MSGEIVSAVAHPVAHYDIDHFKKGVGPIFPVSPLFFETLLFTLPGLASVLIALWAHRSLWCQLTALIPLLLSTIFVSFYAQHGFGLLIALSYLTLTVPVLIGLIFATRFVRRFAPKSAQMLGRSTALLAILATLLFTTYTFVGQWLPNSPCARDRITLAMGTTEVVVPLEMQATIYSRHVPGSFRLDGEASGTFYGSEPHQKYGVRALCHAAARGNGVVPEVDEFWVFPKHIQASVRSVCASSSAKGRAYCRAASRDVLEGVSYVSVKASRSYSWSGMSSEALSVHCYPNHDETPHRCTALFSSSGDVRIEVDMRRPDGENEGVDLEARAREAVQWLAEIWMLDAITPAGS